MVKSIIPSNGYSIDLDTKKIYRDDFKPHDLVVKDGKVKITLYGVEKTVTLDWLKWIAYFGISLPVHLAGRIFDYEFHEHSLHNFKITDPVIVNVRKPMYYNLAKSLILVPRYPDYVLNENNDIIRIQTGFTIRPNGKGYQVVSIYDRVGEVYTVRPVHRIVALVRHYNNDFINKPVVNHIDGVKSNYATDNLEWVSLKENSKHAVVNNLRLDNTPVTIRNIATGETQDLESITVAAAVIGRSRINTAHQPLRRGYVWTGRNGSFEIRLINDKSTWAYENTDSDLEFKWAKHKYVIHYKDGAEKTVYNNSGLKQLYPNFIKYRKDIAECIKDIEASDENIVSITQEKIVVYSVGYEAKHVITGEIQKANSHLDLAKLTNVAKSTITKAIFKGDASANYNNWQIRKITDEPWPEPKELPQNIPSTYELEKDGKVIKINSLRQLADKLTIGRVSLTAKLKESDIICVDGYTIRKI